MPIPKVTATKSSMMTDYRLTGSYYLLPTPKGAFQALIHPSSSWAQQLVLRLLKDQSTPLSNLDTVTILLDGCNRETAKEIIYEAQSEGWIQGFGEAQKLPDSPIDQILKKSLSNLSSSGQALLADLNGYPIADTGFDALHSQHLAALAAELAVLHNRHADYLEDALAIDQPGWGIIDPLGSSKIGAWILNTEKRHFVLLIDGMPNLNRQEFVTLAWLLVHRYG